MSLPPASKLPLAVRKNYRDKFEDKKADLEAELTKILGTPWTIDVDPLALHPYAVAHDSWGKDSLGSCIHGYFQGALSKISYYGDKYKEDGKKELNDIASAHVLTLDVDLSEKPKYTYNTVEVRDGRLTLLTVPKYFGTNDNEAATEEKLLSALNDAPPPAGADTSVSVKVRTSIRTKWDPKAKTVLEELQKILKREDLKLEPNFPEVYAVLKEETTTNPDTRVSKNWEDSIGDVVVDYFDGLRRQLKDAKFDRDEMLQEALNEALETGIIEFHLVKALETPGASYNEVILADGLLKIQTTPKNWWTNSSDTGRNIIDLL